MATPVSGDLAPKWQSPLKPPTPTFNRKEIGSEKPKAAKRLFDDEEPTTGAKKHPSTLHYGSLADIYPAPCLLTLPSSHLQQHALMADLVLSLERTLLSGEILNPEQFRPQILTILQTGTYQEKIEKLGMILFYLDRNGTVPEAPSLTEYRAQEIATEVIRYLEAHSAATRDTLIPSGKTHYLLRAFAHMVITSQQRFNPGGLIVIQKLLTTPAYGIARYLQPEHSEHILTMTCNILANPAIIELFKDEVRIHPDLCDIIRLDLKLNPEESVRSVHILYGCLMALFSDIRQTKGPNCYAISALIYASENYTFKTLSFLLKWLAEGSYPFSANCQIPLRPYLEKRIVHASDLDISVSSREVHTLAPIEHIFSTLEINPVENTSGRKALPIGEVLASPSAKALFHAYKSNCVLQLMLKVLEFVSFNKSVPDKTQPTASPYSFTKQKFITSCMNPILTWCYGKKILPAALSQLEARLGERLWLEPVSENDVTIERGMVLVGSERVTYKGNLDSLAHVFQGSIRIFYLADNQYELIPTISALQRMLVDEIEQVCETLIGSDEEKLIARRQLCLGVQSHLFRSMCSEFISQQITMRGIEPTTLNWADLLILHQHGGHEDMVLNLVYDIPLAKYRFQGCNNPLMLLENLVHMFLFSGINLQDFCKIPRILVATPGKHAWTLAPTRWKLLLENKLSLPLFIEQNLTSPVKIKLGSIIPLSTIKQVIARCPIAPQNQESMIKFYAQRPQMTYREFRDEFHKKAPYHQQPEVEMIIEEEFSKVTLSEHSIAGFLASLHLPQDAATCKILASLIPPTPQMIYQLADVIHQALIEAKIAILDPYDIEIALCKVTGHPLTFHMGDLNYIDSRREDPAHMKLIIQMSWMTEVPAYFSRGKVQKIEPYSQFDTFEIELPTSALSSKEYETT